MARPTNAEVLELANQRAVESIRKELPKLAKRLVDMALANETIKVVCPKDKHAFEVQTERLKDPALVLSLWTRAEGKPGEQKQMGDIERFAQLIGELEIIQEQEDTADGTDPDGPNTKD